jgi:ABC-type dipeptide/oligopeptide/nickel transport system permease component
MAYLLSFLLRRLSQAIVIVLLAALIVFCLLRIGPGNPARLIAGGMASNETVERVTKEMGLGDGIVVQYFRYMRGVLLHGDFGTSFVRPKSGADAVAGGRADDPTRADRARVIDLILNRLPLTLQLAAMAMAIALVVSAPIGLFAGLNAGRWPDAAALLLSSVLVSMPNFWLAGILVLIVSIQFGWLPAVGYRDITYAILPAIVLAIEIIPVLVRSLTLSLGAMMSQNFVRIGPIRGLRPAQVIYRHALKGASVPLLNMLGVQLSALLGGVLVVEYIFDYPGLGMLTIEAVLQRDFPLIQAIAMLTSGIFVVVNILVDMLAGLIDPRLDY